MSSEHVLNVSLAELGSVKESMVQLPTHFLKFQDPPGHVGKTRGGSGVLTEVEAFSYGNKSRTFAILQHLPGLARNILAIFPLASHCEHDLEELVHLVPFLLDGRWLRRLRWLGSQQP